MKWKGCGIIRRDINLATVSKLQFSNVYYNIITSIWASLQSSLTVSEYAINIWYTEFVLKFYKTNIIIIIDALLYY